MFLADKADQEAKREADILKGMQQEAPDADEAAFDNRVVQRQKLFAKREVASQVTIFRHAAPAEARVAGFMCGRGKTFWAKYLLSVGAFLSSRTTKHRQFLFNTVRCTYP